MLPLATANAVGVMLFGALYATAGARLMSQGAFIACFLVVFGLVTTLWVRVEGRHRGLELLSRIGRAAAALVVVVIAVPVVILMPAFWLESQLPPDADFTRHLGPIMVLVLISLALVALANVVGSLIAVTTMLVRRRRRRS